MTHPKLYLNPTLGPGHCGMIKAGPKREASDPKMVAAGH